VLIIAEKFMSTNTFLTVTTSVMPPNENAYWSRSEIVGGRIKRPKFPPDADIEAWLKHNAPLTFQELADVRYCLYHRCSRAGFSVASNTDDQFTLFGRHSALRIINNKARHYLLWKLRLLGRKMGWIGALPETKKPRNR
jgi:hypothetical protein